MQQTYEQLEAEKESIRKKAVQYLRDFNDVNAHCKLLIIRYNNYMNLQQQKTRDELKESVKEASKLIAAIEKRKHEEALREQDLYA
jgi:hypothetical protein